MKKKVLILAGGYSKEREISLKTGKEVYKSIKNKYNAIPIKVIAKKTLKIFLLNNFFCFFLQASKLSTSLILSKFVFIS